MNKIIASLLLVSISTLVNAKNPIHDYLYAAQRDYQITSEQTKQTDLSAVSSWIEEAQFRVNTSTPANNVDIRDNAQSYEIRLQPKAWGQQQQEASILALRLKQQQIRNRHAFNLLLKQRYHKLLTLLQQQDNIQYLLDLSKLLSRKLTLLRSQVSNKQFDAEKLLDTEQTLHLTQAQIDVNLNRLKVLQTQLGIPASTELKTNWLIDIREIKNFILDNQNNYQNSDEIVNSKIKLNLSRAEYELLKAKQSLGIDLVRFEYKNRQNDEMAFQLGVNIPLGTNFNESKNQFASHSMLLQLNENIVKVKQSLADKTSSINWLLDDLALNNAQTRSIQKHLQNVYTKSDPFLTLNLHKSLIERQKKKLAITRRMLGLYIDYLSDSGLLTQQPLRNWIEKGTPEISSAKDS